MTKAQKVAHVRASKQTRGHECHWPGCGKQVPPAMWGCKPHWFKLPKLLRDQVWATYRAGQEITMTPSQEYLDVAGRVQQWIVEQERVEEETERCPKCNSAELHSGYGFAGGVLGIYTVCLGCNRTLALSPDLEGLTEEQSAVEMARAKQILEASP